MTTEVCPDCEGVGVEMSIHQTPNGPSERTRICPTCDGEGVIEYEMVIVTIEVDKPVGSM